MIRDEKELHGDSDYERRQHSFHTLLKEMTYHYRAWKHYDPEWRLDWELSLSDQQVQDILAMKQIWHISHGLQTIHFPNLKTENGIFSLWEVALGEEPSDKKIISFFISDAGVYRPAASRLIWEELLKPECVIEAGVPEMYSDEAWALVEAKAQELATDAFLQLKASYEQRHEQEYKKRQRALTLRIEAAERIGIENIRKARIAKLEATLQQETDTYERQQEICPTFTPVVAFLTR